MHTEEWYVFETNPRANVNVLISLDEATFQPGDYPISWYHEFDGGRSFYTALGHGDDAYSEPEFMAHLEGGIAWAAGAP